MAKSRAASKADKPSKGAANDRTIKQKPHTAKVTKTAKPMRKQSNSSEDSDSEEEEEDDTQSDSEDSDDSSQSDSEDESRSDSDASLKLKTNGKGEGTTSSKPANGTKHTNGILNKSTADSGSDNESTSESEDSQSEESDSDHNADTEQTRVVNGKSGLGLEKGHNSKKEHIANTKGATSITRVSQSTGDENLAESSESNSDDSDDSSKSSGSSQDMSEGTPGEELERKAVQTESFAAKKRKADAVDTPTAKKSKTDASAPSANLFVGNLSWNVDEEWLQREFSEFGDIAGCRVIRDRDSGRSKGFGYVEFNDAGNAAEALEAKKGALLDGREMNVDFSVPRPENANGFNRADRVNDRASKFGDAKSNPSDTLFIGNIAFSATAEELQETFGEYGNVTRVSLPTDQESGAPKGFGYVSFTSIDEAKNALETLNGENIGGRAIRLDYATPRTNGDRGGRGGRGDFRGGRGSDRGGRGGRGAVRGGRGDSRGRGGRGFSTNRGGIGDFSGKKVTF